MIAKLKGIVDTVLDHSVIVEVNGVGYLLFASRHTLGQLSAGTPVTIHVETIMKAEQLSLYGFLSSKEQQCFKLLMTVQGVGAKVALSILSVLTADQVLDAITTQDYTMITRADGVGPKVGQRVVRELKDKVGSLYSGPTMVSSLSAGLSESQKSLSQKEEAISALINLGYRRAEALEAVLMALKDLPQDMTLNQIIPAALKHISKGNQ